MTRPRTQPHPRWAAAWVAGLLFVVVAVGPSGATPPTDDPALAADYGAGWLATQIQPDGSLPGGFDALGDAGNAALSLGATGVGGDAFDRAVGYVRSNIETFVDYPFDPTIDDPARLGKAIMIAELVGEDPTSFGGTDLVTRLESTLGLLEPGLYGANPPAFDGVFRQGLAITGLLAAGETPDADAVEWLVDQQCDAVVEAQGAWEPYRADTSVDCTAPDPNTFTGPDTNSTAMAIMALEANGTSYLDPRDFLAASQEDDGGWAFIPGGGSDPSSTSLVIRAIVSLGDDPAAYVQSGTDAWESLLSWQQGCDAPAGDRGAFTSPLADPPGAPDVFSSVDGVAGAAGAPYPLDGPVSLSPGAPEVDCTGPDGSTTTTTTPAGSPPVVPVAAPASAVGRNPAFTG